MKKWLLIVAGVLVALLAGGSLAVGNYVYTSGTVVPCKINDDDLANKPEEFFTPGPGNGPFPGEGWDKWVNHSLSDWWMTDVPYEAVTIPVSENINLSAWWITPEGGNGKTVIVTHGIGTSRRDYNTLLPTGMLVKNNQPALMPDTLLDKKNPTTLQRLLSGWLPKKQSLHPRLGCLLFPVVRLRHHCCQQKPIWFQHLQWREQSLTSMLPRPERLNTRASQDSFGS